MFKNIFQLGIPALLALGFLFGGVGFTFAQSALPVSANECKVRSTVSVQEVRDLTGNHGSDVVGYYGGATINLNTVDGGGLICTYAMIKAVTNWIFIAVLAVSVLMLAWASFLFVTGGSSQDKQKQARQIILFSVIGLMVALLARVVPSIVRGIIGI